MAKTPAKIKRGREKFRKMMREHDKAYNAYKSANPLVDDHWDTFQQKDLTERLKDVFDYDIFMVKEFWKAFDTVLDFGYCEWEDHVAIMEFLVIQKIKEEIFYR